MIFIIIFQENIYCVQVVLEEGAAVVALEEEEAAEVVALEEEVEEVLVAGVMEETEGEAGVEAMVEEEDMAAEGEVSINDELTI